jgi:hypothetical protein
MSYFDSKNKFQYTEAVALNPVVGTTISADALSAPVEVGSRASLRLTQNVTAIAATSLVTTVQGSFDNVNWFTLGTFASVPTSTPTIERKVFPCARYVRASYDHTGAGAITVTLSGEAA